jgi:hypothetical protein
MKKVLLFLLIVANSTLVLAQINTSDMFSCEYKDKWRTYTLSLEKKSRGLPGFLRLSNGNNLAEINFERLECGASSNHAQCVKSPSYGSNIQCGYQVYVYRDQSISNQEIDRMIILFTDCNSPFKSTALLDNVACTAQKGSLSNIRFGY